MIASPVATHLAGAYLTAESTWVMAEAYWLLNAPALAAPARNGALPQSVGEEAVADYVVHPAAASEVAAAGTFWTLLR